MRGSWCSLRHLLSQASSVVEALYGCFCTDPIPSMISRRTTERFVVAAVDARADVVLSTEMLQSGRTVVSSATADGVSRRPTRTQSRLKSRPIPPRPTWYYLITRRCRHSKRTSTSPSPDDAK